jgi:zinc and cadmium transporter
MLDATLATLLSVVAVSLLSFLGIVFLAVGEKRLQRILLGLVSFSVGALLGDVFIHMLPEIGKEQGFTVGASVTILFGFLFSFVVEKFIHWHHCHDEDCEGHHHAEQKVKPFAIISLIGEAVHNFIDGVIIAAAYVASLKLGLATTLAVVFHEIPHEVGNFALLVHGGFKRWRALLLNAASAVTAILGAVVTIVLSESAKAVAPYLLPFAAGTFLYIAGTDIIPELHKETRMWHNVGQFLLILAGVGVMALLLAFG